MGQIPDFVNKIPLFLILNLILTPAKLQFQSQRYNHTLTLKLWILRKKNHRAFDFYDALSKKHKSTMFAWNIASTWIPPAGGGPALRVWSCSGRGGCDGVWFAVKPGSAGPSRVQVGPAGPRRVTLPLCLVLTAGSRCRDRPTVHHHR